MNDEPETIPDAELVRRWQRAPDTAEARVAIAWLVRRWQERVFGWCARQLGDRDTARDVTQDVLLAACRGLGRLEDPERFAGWLFSIVRFKCISAIRRRRPMADGELLDDLASADEGPAASFEIERARAALRSAIGEVLDAEEQLAVWLRYWEGLPVEEVTRVARLSGRSGARGVLQTARRKLRARLEREGEDAR